VTAFTAAFAFAALFIAPGTGLASPVNIPLHINYALMTAALSQQLYAHGGRAQLWSGNNECEYLYAENPSFGEHNGIVGVETDAYLNLGVPVGDRCLTPITWSGIIQADTTPYIAGFALKFHVTDINLLDNHHKKSLLLGRGFDLIKSSFPPALETYSFDLTPAIHELDELAGMAVAPADKASLHLALASIRLEPMVTVGKTGVQLVMAIELPLRTPSTPIPASAAPLKPEEIAAWNNALDNWDAFLVFAIKQVGIAASDPAVRNELLNILLDSRQRLVTALGEPQRFTGPDPVRLLFIEEWTRLGQVIESAAEKGALGDRSLEFLSFISAGDALFALDESASALGLRISADDLRRLARIMAPQVSGDPLVYSFEEDPQLRQIFGLGTPLQAPGNLALPPESAPAVPQDAGGELPEARVLPQIGVRPDDGVPSTEPTSAPAGRSQSAPIAPDGIAGTFAMLSSALCAISPHAVFAAQAPINPQVSPGQLLNLGQELRAVVVNRDNAARYRLELGRLLDLAALYQLQNDALEDSPRRSWPILLKAAAWQESCWRQFVMKNRRIWYLESKTGDIGLMQVNKYVWRGFYSLARLRWDIVYNLSAGSEILHRLLSESLNHVHSSNPSDVARATYAAYNGGPGAYSRWRQPNEPPALRAIDDAFWVKYQAIAAGQSFDIVTCAAQWGTVNDG
jgi:Transglycosylase SLT domain